MGLVSHHVDYQAEGDKQVKVTHSMICSRRCYPDHPRRELPHETPRLEYSNNISPIECQVKRCRGIMMRSYTQTPNNNQHKKLRRTRLDRIAEFHVLPRVQEHRGQNSCTDNHGGVQTNKHDKPSTGKHTRSNLYRSFSVPDLQSADREQIPRQCIKSEEKQVNQELKTVVNTAVNMSSIYFRLNRPGMWKEEFPSLSQKDREIEFCEIIPQQIVIKNKMKIMNIIA